MPERRVPSDSELREYSGEHLLYELQMLRWLVAAIPSQAKGFALSALLESFVIHLRNLIDFFYGDLARADDVVAGDFFEKLTDWDAGTISKSLEAARERANKEVSHLTHKRKSGGDPTKPWNVVQLARQVQAVAKNFADSASTKKLHAKVIDWVNTPDEKVLLVLARASSVTSNVASQSATTATYQTVTNSPAPTETISFPGRNKPE
jgi:hypothetical protein